MSRECVQISGHTSPGGIGRRPARPSVLDKPDALLLRHLGMQIAMRELRVRYAYYTPSRVQAFVSRVVGAALRLWRGGAAGGSDAAAAAARDKRD
jgi:hypothetical protein